MLKLLTALQEPSNTTMEAGAAREMMDLQGNSSMLQCRMNVPK